MCTNPIDGNICLRSRIKRSSGSREESGSGGRNASERDDGRHIEVKVVMDCSESEV